MILRIKDANGNTQEILAIKGEKGEKGADGTMTFADLTEEQKASLKGDKGDTGAAGKDGTNGKDGVSPVVSVSKVGKETTIAITDAEGTKTATILDGEDGEDGTGGDADLSNYVTKEDLATDDTPGIVYSNSAAGVEAKYGVLKIVPATEDAIAKKQIQYLPIVPKTIDQAVKVGITTNKKTLTDDEKTSACTWLGAAKAEDIPPAVELDTTLTQEGEAADAKAVGDSLAAKAKQPLRLTAAGFGVSLPPIVGTKSESTGKPYTPAEIYEESKVREVTLQTRISTNDSFLVGCFRYSTAYVTGLDGVAESVEFVGHYIDLSGKWIPAVAKIETINSVTKATITDAEWAGSGVETDSTLTQDGFPANAKTVGDRLTELSGQIASNSEAWTFTLEDGSTVTKTVVLK
jgi:hypothetical protein